MPAKRAAETALLTSLKSRLGSAHSKAAECHHRPRAHPGQRYRPGDGVAPIRAGPTPVREPTLGEPSKTESPWIAREPVVGTTPERLAPGRTPPGTEARPAGKPNHPFPCRVRLADEPRPAAGPRSCRCARHRHRPGPTTSRVRRQKPEGPVDEARKGVKSTPSSAPSRLKTNSEQFNI